MKEGNHDSGGGFYFSKFKSLCPVGPLPLQRETSIDKQSIPHQFLWFDL